MIIDISKFLNKIICSECIELLRQLPDKCIDLIISSPPYSDLRSYRGFTFDFKPIAKELTRVLKDGGVLVWVIGDKVVKGSETFDSLRQALYFKDECKLVANDTMIYEKRSYLPQSGKRYDQVWDYMFVFSKNGPPKTFNKLMEKKVKVYPKRMKNFHRGQDGEFKHGEYDNQSEMKKRTNIWRYRTAGGQSASEKIAYKHPAIFPEELATDHILTWTNPGDVVMDPLGGSGTTARQAAKLDRKFITLDMALDYCEISLERIKQFAETEIILVPSKEETSLGLFTFEDKDVLAKFNAGLQRAKEIIAGWPEWKQKIAKTMFRGNQCED